jgi:hypothetical protein
MYKPKEQKELNFIEFAKKGRAKSAKEKMAISQGLEEFWDKKGRAIVTVGGGSAAAAGALLLAGKSGKLPKGVGLRGMRKGNASPFKKPGMTAGQARRKQSLATAMDDASKLGQDKFNPKRMLPGASEMGTGGALVSTSKGVLSKSPSANLRNAAREIYQKGRQLSNQTITAGGETRKAISEVLNTPSSKLKGDPIYEGSKRAYKKARKDINTTGSFIKRQLGRK